jgi:Ca2+-binding EF-hand superfamily protein
VSDFCGAVKHCRYKSYIWREYAAAFLKKMEKLRQIFDRFDKNKNGYINKKELCTLAIALDDPLSTAELHDFFSKVDVDNSGKISWEEFVKYWSE